MNPELTAKGTTPPVSLTQAKSSQRITGTGEDVTLQDVLDSSIAYYENSTGLALTENTYKLRLTGFSDGAFIDNGVIRIPISPFKSDSLVVSYYDTSNTEQTVSASDYQVITWDQPGCIKLASGKNWPSTYDREDAVTITFKAGYANTGLDVPDPEITRGINMLFGKWNDFRADNPGKRLPTGVEILAIRNKVNY